MIFTTEVNQSKNVLHLNFILDWLCL